MELTAKQIQYINLMGIDSYIGAINIKIKDLNKVINSNGPCVHMNYHWNERAFFLNLKEKVQKYKSMLVVTLFVMCYWL